MVDSGVPWIGAIPKDWQVIPLKGLGRFYGGLTGKAGDDFVVNDNDYFELFVPFTNIFNNNVVQLDKLYKVKITVGEKQTLVHKGDILFLMSSEDYEGLGKPALMNDEVEKLHLNSFCKGFTPNSDVVPSFLNYYLQGQSIREYIRSNGNGFIRINLKVSKLGTTPVLLPSLPEQQRIAGFLDAKCAEIDSILDKTRASIEEYKKLKQSVITEAVTKGIHGERPMKDSGVEWIGEIPKEWKVEPLWGTIRRKTEVEHPDEVVLSLYRDYGVIPKDSRDDNHNVTSLDTSNYKFVEVGDLVVNKMKAWQGSMAISSYQGIVSPAYHVCEIHNTNIYRPFLHYLLRNQIYLPEYLRLSTGMRVGQWDLSYDDLRHIPIVIPDIQEQQEIAAHLDEKCAAIDSLITSKEALIIELEAYKKSVIYEYVTGKKEV